MPSEKSRYLTHKRPSPTAFLSRDETLAVLEGLGSKPAAELIWQRSDTDPSLGRQLAVMVLRSRLGAGPSDPAILSLLGHLRDLCEFDAEWRESESGWAGFLAEVASTLEALFPQSPPDPMKPGIRAIIDVVEESSSQMDDCFSCGLEIERMERLLAKGAEI